MVSLSQLIRDKLANRVDHVVRPSGTTRFHENSEDRDPVLLLRED